MQLNRVRFLTMPILLALLFSALTVTTALADDNVPPPPTDTATQVAPPVDVSTSTDPTPVATEAAPVDPAPVVDTSAPVQVAAANILAQVPEGTNVVIVNSDGNTLPLASQEAAQAIVKGDPMWCPAGVAPGAATCSPSFTTFNQDNSDISQTGLIDWLVNNDPNKAGVIWVESGYNGSLETGNYIDLINSSFSHLNNFALTIQGGWNGTNGSTTLNPALPSTITVPFWIQGWTGAIILKNLTVDDSSTPVALGFDDHALYVTTAGTITLDNIKVQNNSDTGNTLSGAYLDNTSSSASAIVTITNSFFDQNQGDGLELKSDGIVTINSISANGNGGFGTYINNISASTDKAVTFTGIQQFNNNGDNGLAIQSRGAVTLANVVANNNNGSHGVFVDNENGTTNQGVTIKGVNQMNNTSGIGGDGLYIASRGAITLNSITTNNNNGSGTYLYNFLGGKAVTLTGTNTFNGNGTNYAAYGLSVISRGAITVSNITASNNSSGGDDGGVQLNNNYTGAVGGITINGYGTFEHNAKYGLEATSLGVILLNNINANNNGTGAFISNCANPNFAFGYMASCDATPAKAITFKGTNNFNGNSGYGLEALSNSTITASGLTASGNGSSANYSTGITIGNAYLAGMAGITLTGSNTFNNDTNSAGRGVVFYSTKAITISNLTANGNAGYGALITNQFAPTVPGNVTLSGTSQFNGNGNTGLNVYTYGTILLNNITANYNTGGGNGIQVDNSMGLPKAITLTGFNSFSGNASSGMDLNSLGVITLNNIIANNNLGAGAYLHNEGMMVVPTATSPGITIKGDNSFSNNAYGGIEMSSYGTITLNNINANDNAWVGARVSNGNGLLKAVTFTGVNNFNGNGFGGLIVSSKGVVTLTRITANDNDPTNAQNGSGVYVDNYAKSIILTCGFAYNNGTYGFYLHTANNGLVTVKGVYSFSNGTDYDITLPNIITYPCTLP